MRNTTFISSMVLSVACVSAANAAVAFDTFTVAQTDTDPAAAWATPALSQPIFGASGTRLAIAQGPPGSTTSVSGGTATFTTTRNGWLALSYSGSAQNLTGYTFSFDLNMTGAGSAFEMVFVGGAYAQYFVNYTTAGTYTIDLSTVPFNGAFDFTAITDITIGMLAQTEGSATVSNFTYTVPAPGAIALLGAAGLVGGRRRRD